jgi:hypothetical protein
MKYPNNTMIKEYLNLIPVAVKNADKIWNGIINEVKIQFNALPEDEQLEIAKRRTLCAVCPFNSSNAVSNPALNYKTDRFDEHCIHCQCNLAAKTASLISNCGIETYNEQHPKDKMELRWVAYKNQNNEE